MEVILKKRVETLGDEGDILTVANGYARNYLIPMQLAVRATEKNRRMLEHERQLLAAQGRKSKSEG